MSAATLATPAPRRRRGVTLEAIRWRASAAELPDDETTVLGYHPAWGDRCWPCSRLAGEWFTVEGAALSAKARNPEQREPTHWAPWPFGPDVIALESEVPE